jgi:hypothetical protein
VPLRALCGKNNKFTTDNTEKHKEQKPLCPLRDLCGKTINSPRRTQRNTEKKTSVPLRDLCGKNKKFTTENTEKHREKNLRAPLCPLW